MRNRLLLFVAQLLCFTASWAQTQVATLNHNGDISVFYGPNGFQAAVNMATDDDVINLSAGIFQPATINHRLRIYGAGMYNFGDERNATVISKAEGRLNVMSGANGSHLEGININATIASNSGSEKPHQLTFSKCLINSQDQQVSNHSVFSNCIVNVDAYNDTCFFYNCFVNSDPTTASNAYAPRLYRNCIVKTRESSALYKNEYANCVILFTVRQSSIRDIINATNNICIGADNGASHFMAWAVNGTNWLIPNISDVFKTFDGNYTLGCDFELTDAAKQYLGTDGKQVGIYGGTMPFTPIVSNPRITRLDTDRETSTEGKLNVSIEVQEGQ